MSVQVHIDTGRNRLLLAGFLLLQVLQLVLVPVVLLPHDAAWGWLLVIPLLLSNSWWAFMHEALHGHLFPNREVGRAMGRLNAVLYGAAFDLLRCGHLLHHAYSRTRRERFEVYRADEAHLIAAAAGYYFRLLGGLYLLEILGSLIFLLPRALIRRLEARIASDDNVVEELTRRMLMPATLAAVRADTLAMLLVYGMAFYWYGSHWWMLALALWGRGLLVSLMDNAFHYGTPLDQPRYAPNLAAPAWWSRLLLNFNLHGAHHRQPAVPWHALAQVHRHETDGYQGSLLRAILSQLRGPIPEHKLRTDQTSGITIGRY
jgi:fatty acid desaturase